MRLEPGMCPEDAVMQAFVSHRLAVDELKLVDAHLADCSACAALIANASPAMMAEEPGPLPPGASIDRYHILSTAGKGAMGVVYAAYDPKLDRKVALKVLRRAGRDLEERLLREARAMARLSHPNVIAVHDVGTSDGGLYVAMDFVEGKTLGEWLGQRARPPAEIVAAFIEAGRGLAAAHGAGIVHRDFKPDNVLVAADGRIAVTDFGLARSATDLGGGGAPGELAGAALALTATGALLGTPAYMSPEQLAGRAVDARADLFSFCVALYRALFGHHPFPLTSVRELLLSVEKGQVAPPGDVAVPRAVRDAILAGLRPRPEDRPQGMPELLRALQPTQRRATPLALAGVGLAGVIAVALVALLPPKPAAPVCRAPERKLAGVWDATRRAQVVGALGKTGSPLAAQTARTVERLFDGYAAAWLAAHVDACEAVRVRGEQSEAMLDRRMACLEDRRQRFAALVGSLAEARESDVAKAALAAYDLPLVDACADPRRLGAPDSPVAPAFEPLVALARRSLSKARALGSLGRYDDGQRELAPALVAARAARSPSLEAEARLVDGLLRFEGDPRGAETALRAAIVAAERAGRLDVTAEAEVRLVKNLGYRQARTDDALRVSELTEAHVERLGDAVLDGEYLSALGAVQQRAGNLERGLELEQVAAEKLSAALGEGHAKVAVARNMAGICLRQLGRLPEAVDEYGRALAIDDGALGHEHPETLKVRFNIANIQFDLGHTRQSLELHRGVAASFERLLGPEHPHVGAVLSSVGNSLSALERFAEAVPVERRALEITERGYGSDSPQLILNLGMLGEALASTGATEEADAVSLREMAIGEHSADRPDLRNALVDRGSVLFHAGRCREAVPWLERAVRMFEEDGDGQHDLIGYPLEQLGRCRVALGQPREAEAALTRALAVRKAKLPPGHPLIGAVEEALAELELAQGHKDRARERAEAALATLRTADHPPLEARTRFALARALWPVARERARMEAVAAMGFLAETPAHPLRTEVLRWLADPR